MGSRIKWGRFRNPDLQRMLYAEDDFECKVIQRQRSAGCQRMLLGAIAEDFTCCHRILCRDSVGWDSEY